MGIKDFDAESIKALHSICKQKTQKAHKMDKQNSLAVRRPDIAKEWHPTKNIGLVDGFGRDISTPDKVSEKSSQNVWWFLPYDVPEDYPIEHLRGKHFDFEWNTRISHRTNGIGCPYLSNPPQAVWKGFNDLATVSPELAREWHPTKNEGLTNKNGENISTPDRVTYSSSQEVWWFLPYDIPWDYPVEHLRGKHFDFEWKALISNRSKGGGCPFLSVPAKAVWKGFNDLKTVNPELAKEWHPTKNADLKPDSISGGCNTKVWWLYPYDVPDDYPIEHLRGKHFDFEWKTSVNNRILGNNCPYLSGRAVWKGFNDLETVYPDLAKEWHPTKNGNKKPYEVTWCSGQKVWWLFPYDDPKTGKHFDFEWQATIASRISGNGCPYLSNEAVWTGYNDLNTVNPELAKEWHPTKNGMSTPYNTAPNSNKTVWWFLPYDVPDDYPVHHLRGKHFDFEWQATVYERMEGNGCPYLSGRRVYQGFNDLKTVNPELAKEWHPFKNGNLKPSEVTINNSKKVWWFLPYDDPETGEHFDFEWKAFITARTRGSGCPYLSTSRGEYLVQRYLKEKRIPYVYEKTFDSLVGIGGGLLSYDFFVIEINTLIEYQGIQHYEASEYFGGIKQYKKQREHDKRKREFAEKKGYRLIEISYEYDTYDSISDYLDNCRISELYNEKREQTPQNCNSQR